MKTGKERRGFTLIELMLVVAIIGVLAAIALPKFANLVVKSKEAVIKGQLGALRSAVSIYYSDNEGLFPGIPVISAIVPKYMDAIPEFNTHPMPNGIAHSQPYVGAVDYILAPTDGRTPWYYDFATGTGIILVHCTHTDSTGVLWTTY